MAAAKNKCSNIFNTDMEPRENLAVNTEGRRIVRKNDNLNTKGYGIRIFLFEETFINKLIRVNMLEFLRLKR